MKTLVAFCFSVLFIVCTSASGILIGGRQNVNLNENEGASQALAHAVRLHGSKDSRWMVTKVLSAESQVVAGMKYFFTVLIVRTDCKVGSVKEACNIPQVNAETYKCDFIVWSRPWISSTTVTEKCNKLNSS